MDTSSEEFERIDGDPQMTMLTHEDVTEEDPGISDEVEDLQNRYKSINVNL